MCIRPHFFFFQEEGQAFTAFYSAPSVGHTTVNGQLKTGRAAQPPARPKESPAGTKAGSRTGGAFRKLPPGQAWLWGGTQPDLGAQRAGLSKSPAQTPQGKWL